MKTLITFCLAFLASTTSFSRTFFDQLCAFNFNWEKYKTQVPKQNQRCFKTDDDLVYTHLSMVLPILKSNSIAELSNSQLKSRLHLIELLNQYRQTKRFPKNTYLPKRVPVFIDQHQTHCAVAFLMQQSGYEKLALQIAADNNFAWVKDITTKGVLEWQLQSGLTLEELKLIQGAYDYYMPRAFFHPDKYNIPQKPECILAYFKKANSRGFIPENKQNIWCHGEGVDGVLNGRWVQNFAIGFPWIIGNFTHGKRSGQWFEYYKGTKNLCRTEYWDNDKLNGIRKRFNLDGQLIEEINFVEGVAVTKINYNLDDSLTYVRKPIDSSLVYTKIYNANGRLIAKGKERIYNPGNLLWFQNIELTALNSIAIQSRTIATKSENDFQSNFGNNYSNQTLYNTPPLVEYIKEDLWVYYAENPQSDWPLVFQNEHMSRLMSNYKHFGKSILELVKSQDTLAMVAKLDSIRVGYFKDQYNQYSPQFVQKDFYIRGEYIEMPSNYFFSSFGTINLNSRFSTSIIHFIDYQASSPNPKKLFKFHKNPIWNRESYLNRTTNSSRRNRLERDSIHFREVKNTKPLVLKEGKPIYLFSWLAIFINWLISTDIETQDKD
jgi:hypothetical protein